MATKLLTPPNLNKFLVTQNFKITKGMDGTITLSIFFSIILKRMFACKLFQSTLVRRICLQTTNFKKIVVYIVLEDIESNGASALLEKATTKLVAAVAPQAKASTQRRTLSGDKEMVKRLYEDGFEGCQMKI